MEFDGWMKPLQQQQHDILFIDRHTTTTTTAITIAGSNI